METNSPHRICEKFENNSWVPVEFSSIKKSDVFRLIDTDENPIETGAPKLALEDAFKMPEIENFGVRCEPFTIPLAAIVEGE